MKKLINFSLFIALIASSGSLPLHAQASTEQKSSFLPAWAQSPGFQAAKKWWKAGRDESVLSPQEKRAFKRLKRKVKLGTIVTAIGTALGASAYWYLNEQQKQAAHAAAAAAKGSGSATASATGPYSSSRSESGSISSGDDSQDSAGAAAGAAAASTAGSDSSSRSKSDTSSSEDDSPDSAGAAAHAAAARKTVAAGATAAASATGAYSSFSSKSDASSSGDGSHDSAGAAEESDTATLQEERDEKQKRWTAATGGGLLASEVNGILTLTNQWQDALGQWIATTIPLVASENPKSLIKFDLPEEPTPENIIGIYAWVETPADTSEIETFGLAKAAHRQPKETTTENIGPVFITEEKGAGGYTYTGQLVPKEGPRTPVGVDYRKDLSHPRGLYLFLTPKKDTPLSYTTKERIPFFIG